VGAIADSQNAKIVIEEGEVGKKPQNYNVAGKNEKRGSKQQWQQTK
jgi:hypothetical protein